MNKVEKVLPILTSRVHMNPTSYTTVFQSQATALASAAHIPKSSNT